MAKKGKKENQIEEKQEKVTKKEKHSHEEKDTRRLPARKLYLGDVLVFSDGEDKRKVTDVTVQVTCDDGTVYAVHPETRFVIAVSN